MWVLPFFFLVVWSSVCAAAETTNPKDSRLNKLLADIQDRVNNTKTVQSSFEQERNLSLFTRPIIFTGKLTLSRPDKLRWENIDPVPSVLIFSGETGLRCNDDAEPVHFDLKNDPMMQMIADQLWTWVDGDYGRLQNRYDINSTGAYEITLHPQSVDLAGSIDYVQVRFDPENLQPEKILIQEKEGDSTTIDFGDYLLNQPIDDILFTTCYP